MKNLLITIAALVLVGCGNPSKSLYEGIKNGNIEQIKKAISEGAEVKSIIEVNRIGSSYPIFFALDTFGFNNGVNIEVIKLLIDEGANLNVRTTKDKKTPLHIASLKWSKEVVELLLDNDADVNVKDFVGRTPLHIAASSKYSDLSSDIVKLLIERGANVNATWNSKGTPLHDATFRGHKEVAALLISNGADINAIDNGGWSLLHFAAYGNHKEIAELLISKGAGVNAINNDGNTPLHVIVGPKDEYGLFDAETGTRETVELLIENGADVNTKNKNDNTSLDIATENQNTETADLLRKHGGKTCEELKAEGK